MKLLKGLAAASSCAVLALFAISADAQDKPKLDANGMPCNGELDGALQCFKPGTTTNTQPLIVPTAAQGGAADAQGRAQYRLRLVNNELQTTPLEQTAGLTDVWRVQFSIRYTFN